MRSPQKCQAPVLHCLKIERRMIFTQLGVKLALHQGLHPAHFACDLQYLNSFAKENLAQGACSS